MFSDNSDLNILAIGQMGKNILLITNGFSVYEINSNELNSVKHQFFLNKQPVSLESKYSKLYSDLKKAMESNQLTGFIACYKNIYYLTLSELAKITSDIDVFQSILTYDITDNKIIPQISLQINGTLISSQICGQFYSILNADGWMIAVVKFDAQFNVLKQINFKICFTGDNKIFAQDVSSNKECTSINLIPIQGFTINEMFYIFTKGNIVVFSEILITRPGNPVELEYVEYKKFFICIELPYIQNRK